MSAEDARQVTVTVRTRLGQVLDRELADDESSEVREALLQMVAALFELQNPGSVRSVTFEFQRS